MLPAHQHQVQPSADDATGQRSDDRHPPETVAPAKYFLPQPAIAVNNRGPKSRAGLIAYPALKPNVMPINTTSRPTAIAPWEERGVSVALVANGKHAADQKRRTNDLIDRSAAERQRNSCG